MPGWWSANDFRHARIALIGVSVASWVPFLTTPADALAIPVAGVLHLALLASLAFEVQPWPARLFSAVLLLPSSVVAAVFAAVEATHAARGELDPLVAPAALLFALAHAAQLWRLAGLPILPLHPIAAPVTDDFFHQAAPEQRAERIAGR